MVYTESFSAPPLNLREAMRYGGMAGAGEDMERRVRGVYDEISDKLCYRVCCGEFEIAQCGDVLDLGFMKTDSRGLMKNLHGCGSIVLFAATVGIELDRYIAMYGVTEPHKSLIAQAIGAERIESLCDVFSDKIEAEAKSRGLYTRPRFSPGYGDFPLGAQREIFKVLDCPRKIGLTLNQSMLMSPSKSVTAIIGLSKEPKNCGRGGCSSCENTDCNFRSEEYQE